MGVAPSDPPKGRDWEATLNQRRLNAHADMQPSEWIPLYRLRLMRAILARSFEEKETPLDDSGIGRRGTGRLRTGRRRGWMRWPRITLARARQRDRNSRSLALQKNIKYEKKETTSKRGHELDWSSRSVPARATSPPNSAADCSRHRLSRPSHWPRQRYRFVDECPTRMATGA